MAWDGERLIKGRFHQRRLTVNLVGNICGIPQWATHERLTSGNSHVNLEVNSNPVLEQPALKWL